MLEDPVGQPQGKRSKASPLLTCCHQVILDKQDRFGKTALHIASGANLIRHTELLLNRHASIDVKDHQGRTPIKYAHEKGARDVRARLLREEKRREQQGKRLEEARNSPYAPCLVETADSQATCNLSKTVYNQIRWMQKTGTLHEGLVDAKLSHGLMGMSRCSALTFLKKYE